MTDRISPADAAARVADGWTFLDVRSVPEFEQGHPAGAYNIPLLHQGPAGMQPNPRFVEVVKATFPLDTKLVLGCRSGGRSLRALETLAAQGYTQLADQRAGWGGAHDSFGALTEPGWEAAGLPTATEAEEGRSYADLE